MRKLILKMSFSIDGFVAGPNGENDWIFKSSDEQSRAWAVSASWDAGLIIMGRKSFEQMAPYWPTAAGPFAAPMNEIPKAVFTQKGYQPKPADSPTPAALSWAEARVFTDLTNGINQLKQEPGKPILAIGGANFARSLIESGLVDEIHVINHPVLLGAGLPVFNNLKAPLHLKLMDVKSFPSGIVAHIYQPG